MATRPPNHSHASDSERPWQGPERRSLNEDAVRLMIHESAQDAIEDSKKETLEHMDKQFKELSDFVASAFPNGDPAGHRQAHEKAIRDADWWAKFKLGLFEKLAVGGISGALIFLAMAAFEAFKIKLGLK